MPLPAKPPEPLTEDVDKKPTSPLNPENQLPAAPPAPEKPDQFKEIPAPPRRPDGNIDWGKISDDLLAALVEKFAPSEIGERWGVTSGAIYQQISKRKEAIQTKAAGGSDEASGQGGITFRSRRGRYQRPTKFSLFSLLWTMPATHIAKTFTCSQGTVLGWAEELGLEGPGPRYWQRKKNGIKVVAPPHIRELYFKLRDEAAKAGEELGEIPDVFKTNDGTVAESAHASEDQGSTETQPASNPEACPGGSTRKEGKRILLELDRGELLERLWRNPATRVAEELGMCSDTLLRKARELGLGPHLPPEDHWIRRKSGDPIIIPESIQKIIAHLRAEASRLLESERKSESQAPNLSETGNVQQSTPPSGGTQQSPTQAGN